MRKTKEPKAETQVANGAPKDAVDRRGFLRSVGGASVAGAAVAAGVPAAAEASESRGERDKARYRETEHVKAFYRTNRY